MNQMLFLTGMPASGKTYWMQQLAVYFQCPSIDMDQMIESNTGLSITDLFAQGEVHFRIMEQEALQMLIPLQGQSVIVATGGGTPYFHDNMDVMKRIGKVIFLDTPLNELVRRISTAQTEERPLFAGGEPEGILQTLYEQRKAYYLQADLIVNTAGITTEGFARLIREQFFQDSNH